MGGRGARGPLAILGSPRGTADRRRSGDYPPSHHRPRARESLPPSPRDSQGRRPTRPRSGHGGDCRGSGQGCGDSPLATPTGHGYQQSRFPDQLSTTRGHVNGPAGLGTVGECVSVAAGERGFGAGGGGGGAGEHVGDASQGRPDGGGLSCVGGEVAASVSEPDGFRRDGSGNRGRRDPDPPSLGATQPVAISR